MILILVVVAILQFVSHSALSMQLPVAQAAIGPASWPATTRGATFHRFTPPRSVQPMASADSARATPTNSQTAGHRALTCVAQQPLEPIVVDTPYSIVPGNQKHHQSTQLVWRVLDDPMDNNGKQVYFHLTPTSELTNEQLMDKLNRKFDKHNGKPMKNLLANVGRKVAKLLAKAVNKSSPNYVLEDFSVQQLLDLNVFEPSQDCTEARLEELSEICERFCTLENISYYSESQVMQQDFYAHFNTGIYCWSIVKHMEYKCGAYGT